MKNKKLFTWLTMSLFLLLGTKFSRTQANFWEQTKGPEGGFIHAFTITPSGDILAATEGAGVFISTDNGNSWTEVNDGFDSIAHTHIEEFVIDVSNGYIFGGSWGTFGGVYRSPVNNIGWTKFNNGLTNTDVECLAIKSDEYIFAGTNGGGVFRSADHGETWIPVNNGLIKKDVLSLVIDLNGNIYAGTGDWDVDFGIFRSVDNGDSWNEVYAGTKATRVYALAVDSNTGRIFAGTFREGLFYSDDGLNWNPFNIEGLNTEVITLFINSSGDIFAGTTYGLFRFIFSSSNWTQLNIGLQGVNQPAVGALALKTLTGGGEYIYAGITWGGGIIRSEDNGETWNVYNSGLRSTHVLSMAINANDDIFAGTWGSGVFRTADYGENWDQINNGITNLDIWSLALNSSGHIFAGIPFNGVFRSIDNGNTWSQTNLSTASVHALAVNSHGEIFAGTYWGDGMFRLSASGGSYTPVNNGLPASPQIPNIETIAINANNHIFIGTEGHGVYRSMDNGESWEAVNEGLTHFHVKALAIHPPTGDIFAGTWGGRLFRSKDNGETWALVQNSPWYIESLIINSEGHIFVGYGFYRSTDDGQTWEEITSGLTNFGICDFVIDHNGYLYAGTSGCGVFRSTEPTVEYTLDNLIKEVEESNIHHGIKNSLLKKLENAQKSIEKGNINAAINKLRAFQNEVRAQSGKKIPVELAERWITISEKIIQSLSKN